MTGVKKNFLKLTLDKSHFITEMRNAYSAFSKKDNSMAACALPNGTDRRNAMLSAIRQYCSPKEQETIDTILNLFCVMDNYELFNS